MKILDDPEFIDHNGEIYDYPVKSRHPRSTSLSKTNISSKNAQVTSQSFAASIHLTVRLSLVNSLQTPPGRHGLLIGENSWLSKCCFHLTLIFLTLIFVGFRPSKIHMALSLKTRNFNFGDPTTPRTPSCTTY